MRGAERVLINRHGLLLCSGIVIRKPNFVCTIREGCNGRFNVIAIRRLIVAAAVVGERWVLSLVFFWLGWMEFVKARGIFAGVAPVEAGVKIDVGHHLVLCALGCLTGAFLLTSRRPSVLPERIRFMVVPLGTTFFTLLYYLAPWFPAPLRVMLCPTEWRSTLLLVGLTLIIIGPLISLWAILHLRRSFGVFVAVREVVLSGPYRWVRHPMYLGWIVICAGVAIANFSTAYFLLTGAHVALLVYRARLEESQLVEYSAEYRDHRRRTGFVFPNAARQFP
jgi:protein-S-isoprenylcysteine O-methyltransferase Ste14